MRSRSIITPYRFSTGTLTGGKSRHSTAFGSEPDCAHGEDHERRSGNLARRSINRASTLIRRSVAKVFPSLDAPVPPSRIPEVDITGSPDPAPAAMVPAMIQMPPAPYAAHMRSTSGLTGLGSGHGAMSIPIDHPRAEWAEWNLNPGGPGERFWHRFSLAVHLQREPSEIFPLGTHAAGLSAPTGTTARTWLATERARSKRFTRILALAFALLVIVVVIAAALGASLSRRSHPDS